jgi:two-component system, OmpR family, sensor kinase
MSLELPKLGDLDIPKLGFAAFRRRIIFRAAFLLLIVFTLTLALEVLKDEKQRSVRLYSEGTKKTMAELVAKLRHPSGQLALLNPEAAEPNSADLIRPLVLPYAGLDFADQTKAQQTVETVGCPMQYPDGSTLCVAVGNSARSGGFVYVLGSFATTSLKARDPSELDLTGLHRARVTLNVEGQVTRWIAPFELTGDAPVPGLRGRLTGFVEDAVTAAATSFQALERQTRPVKEFRAWVWQDADCVQAGAAEEACPRRTFYSIRLPVEAFRDAIFGEAESVWPPKVLAKTGIRMEMFGPGSSQAIFDSATPGAAPPFSWSDLESSLAPGETLTIRARQVKAQGTVKVESKEKPIITLRGKDEPGVAPAWWIAQLISYLPLGPTYVNASASETMSTLVGRYDLSLNGDVRAVERNLAATATRLSWFVGAMLGAIVLAWVVIEIGLIRRIAVLTKRAAALSHNVNVNTAMVGELEVADLRGKDELGILAGGLADLLQRVKSDLKREQIRAAQERDTWHAVGHEIMSPLQSLMVLHGQELDPSYRYVKRMQQAVKVLYGSASPSEAIESSKLQLGVLELVAFLQNVADNAHFAGIDSVQFSSSVNRLLVHADEYSLEDVVTHVLNNANRYRVKGSPIKLSLSQVQIGGVAEACLGIENLGPPIPLDLIDTIFEYGVSALAVKAADAPQNEAMAERRGQGLFVAKTYMSKMQGSIRAENIAQGVRFELRLPCA